MDDKRWKRKKKVDRKEEIVGDKEDKSPGKDKKDARWEWKPMIEDSKG